MFTEVVQYMFGAAEAMGSISGSSLLTTTEVSSEVILLLCGIFAGWLAYPVMQATCFKSTASTKLAMKLAETTVTVDDSSEDDDGLEEDQSIFTPCIDESRDAGYAVLEKYGVFGAAPGAWSSRL